MGRISTNALERALEQLIQARTAGVRASIKPSFVSAIIKELLDYRKEEELILEEVEDLIERGIL